MCTYNISYILNIYLEFKSLKRFSGSMVEHLSSEQKVVGSCPIWSKLCVGVAIRRFRVRIPGGID